MIHYCTMTFHSSNAILSSKFQMRRLYNVLSFCSVHVGLLIGQMALAVPKLGLMGCQHMKEYV